MRRRAPKVVAVYPLINKVTGEESGMYTITNYDEYVFLPSKRHYIKGDVQLYSSINSRLYKDIELIPEVIEDDETFTTNWKCMRNNRYIKPDLITAYVSRELLK